MEQNTKSTAECLEQKRIAAVVVTYNRLEMLRQCLRHLEMQTRPCDVLVVNNASADGTDAFLGEYTKAHACVYVHNQPSNTGGAGGFHHGMRWAVEAGYDYVWVMDDDCLPNADALEKLMDADELLGSGYGWLSSVALWTDGRECKMNRPKLRKSYYERIDLMQYGLVAAEQATFVSCFFPAQSIRKAGLPIKEFFIWGDDIEYTRRMSVRMGMDCFVCGQSIVTHAMQENTGSSIAADSAERLSRYHYAFRNENYLYRQEGIKGFAYYFAKCALNILRVLFRAKDHKWKRCWIIVKQFFAGFLFHPEITYVGE